MPAIMTNTRYDTNKYRNATTGAIPVIKIERVNAQQVSAFLNGTNAQTGFTKGMDILYKKEAISFTGKIIGVQEGVGGFSEGQPFTVLNIEVEGIDKIDTNTFHNIYDGTIEIKPAIKVAGVPMSSNNKKYLVIGIIIIAAVLVWKYRSQIKKAVK